jgi:hypothetical protein
MERPHLGRTQSTEISQQFATLLGMCDLEKPPTSPCATQESSKKSCGTSPVLSHAFHDFHGFSVPHDRHIFGTGATGGGLTLSM